MGKTPSQKRNWTVLFFVAPGLIFLFFLTLYPLSQTIWMSFFKMTSEGRIFTGLENYQKIFQDNLFWSSLWHTIYFTVITVGLHFLIGLGLALILYRLGNSLLTNILKGFLFLPWLYASAVWCITWQLIFHPYFSVINELFNSMGLAFLVQPWLSDPSILPLTIAAFVGGLKWYPFHMLMIFTSLQIIPRELFDAADIDGASGFWSFRSIIWPFLKPVTAILLTFDTMGTFYYFDLIWILTKGGPMNKSEVVSTYIYKIIFNFGNFEYGASIAFLLMIVLTIITLVYMKIFLTEEFEV